MVRSVTICIVAVLFSWVLLYVSIAGWLSRTRSGKFVRDPHVLTEDYGTVQEKYGKPFELMNEAQKEMGLIVFPLISIAIGVFVGLSTNTRAGWIAVISLLPLQIFLLEAGSFALGTCAQTIAYLLLAYLCANTIGSLRRRRQAAKS